jgi:alpha-N-arabinofuranosidase
MDGDVGALRGIKVGGEMLTAEKMDQYNEFGKAPAVALSPYNGAVLAGGILKLDLPAKSVVVVGLE